jgi:NADH-quinone oxidoreductase subunit C
MAKLDAQSIFAHLQSRCGDAVKDFTTDGTKDPYCKVVPAKWHDVALVLRDDPALRFDFLQCVTGVDWPKQEILQVVYHLYSYPLRHSFVVKADLPRAEPVVPSVADVWAAADWNEREQFDLLGIGFSGHPDLRRVMLPDDWVGHPLRKDWKEPARYREMPTTRPSPMELLKVYDTAPPEKKRLPIVGNDGAPPASANESE